MATTITDANAAVSHNDDTAGGQTWSAVHSGAQFTQELLIPEKEVHMATKATMTFVNSNLLLFNEIDARQR